MLGRGQRVETGLEHALQRRRDARCLDAVLDDAPPVAVRDDDAGLDEPGDELLDVEGIAVGCRDDEIGQGARDVVHPLQDLADQQPAVTSRERRQVEADVMVAALTPVWAALEQRGPRRGDDEHRALAQVAVRLVHPVERAVVGPVQVLEEDDHRVLGGKDLEALGRVGDGLVPQLLRVVTHAVGRSAGLSPRSKPNHRAMTPALRTPSGPGPKTRLKPAAHFSRTTSGPSLSWISSRLTITSRSRAFGRFSPDGDARPRNHHTDSGISASQRSSSPSRRDLPTPASPTMVITFQRPSSDDLEEPVLQLPELEITADCAGLDALDPPSGVQPEAARTLVQHLEPVDRVGDAFELETGTGPERERAAHVPVGVARDQDAPHRSRRLEAGGPVDRLPDDRHLLPRALVQHPDHHVAAVDADPHGERHAVHRLDLAVELLQCVAHGEGGTDRQVRILLARLADPEHRHHGVADELLDHTAVRLDVVLPAGEVPVDDGPDVLGVQRLREHGEVDQVREQDGDELALLALGPGEERGALLPQGLQGGVDHGIAEHGTLRFERGDRLIDAHDLVHLPASGLSSACSAHGPNPTEDDRPDGLGPAASPDQLSRFLSHEAPR